MAKECGSVDIKPILRILEDIKQEQREQRKALQLLGKALFSGEEGSGNGFQNVVDLDVRPLLGIPDKVRADLQNQNATLQMMRRDIWTVSNKIDRLDRDINNRLIKIEQTIVSRTAEFIRTYFGRVRLQIDGIERMIVIIGNRTQEIRKFCNDILYGVNEANRKLNALSSLGELRKFLNDILFGTNQANIKLNALTQASQATSAAIRALVEAVNATRLVLSNAIKSEVTSAVLTLNTNMNGIPGRVINPLTSTMRDNTLTINNNVNGIPGRVIQAISPLFNPILANTNTIIALIRGLPTVGLIDSLAQRIITQLSAVAQQNTRLIVDRIISLPIPEMQKVLNQVLTVCTDSSKKIDEILKRLGSGSRNVSKLITRIYNLVGGDRFFNGDSDNPELVINPEGDIKFWGSRVYNTNGGTNNVTVGGLDDFFSALAATIFYRSGLHRLPAKVPAKIHLKPGEEDREQTISTSLDFSTWQFQQLDSALGMYPLRIKYKDAQGTEKWLEIPNIAEGMSEIIGLLLSLDSDTDIITEAQFKTIGEAVQTKAAISLVNDYVVMISDFLGFKYDIGERKMPIPINPKATNLKAFMEKSEQSIQKAELREPDTNDVSVKLNQLLIATGVIKAALSRKADQGGLPGDYIKQEIDRVDTDWNEFKSFINNYPTSLRQPGQPKPKIDDRTVLIADEVNNNQP